MYKIMRLASRIDELRKDGVKITTHMKVDRQGSRYAEYSLCD